MSAADGYRHAAARIQTLVDEQHADIEVPTCPGWTTKDVVAHLADFFTVFRAGDEGGGFAPGWADDGVKRRNDQSLAECVAEWNELIDQTPELFESRLAAVAVADVVAHEQDIRTALGKPGAQDDEHIVSAVQLALSFLEQQSGPAFRVITDDLDQQVGDGDPVATLRTSTFELFRALHGRRTRDQVRVMDWDGDPDRVLDRFFLFGPTERAVEG